VGADDYGEIHVSLPERRAEVERAQSVDIFGEYQDVQR
jgi:hypothetical protein